MPGRPRSCRVKLSFSDSLALVRAAPRGRRFETLGKIRQLVRDHAAETAPRYLDVGEFKSFEQFEIKYRQLAEELGRPGRIPAEGEMDFLHEMAARDGVRYPGGIGSRDYFFLTALISILAPRRAVEIGTLTGFSTAIIAAAIYRQHGKPGGIAVETIDSHTHCSIDETRPIGFEIPELVPNLVSTVRVHTGRESDCVGELAAREKFGLAFIDADHRHPWPLLDVLRLAPHLDSRSWIVMHDIQLGTYGQAERDAGRNLGTVTPFGAEWFFDRWPFRKIRSFHIGAIELPAETEKLIAFAIEMLRLPSELSGKSAERARREVYRSIATLL